MYGTDCKYRNEGKRIDAEMLSPLDGVTMEVTGCSDTSVTVRIVNVTDKDMQCGEEFCYVFFKDSRERLYRKMQNFNRGICNQSEKHIYRKISEFT